MLAVTKRKPHKPVLNLEDEPYEYKLKPENGKRTRTFNLCCYCGVLFKSNTRGQCPDGPMLDGTVF